MQAVMGSLDSSDETLEAVESTSSFCHLFCEWSVGTAYHWGYLFVCAV